MPGIVWSAATPLLPAAAWAVTPDSAAALPQQKVRHFQHSLGWELALLFSLFLNFYFHSSPCGNKPVRGWRCLCNLPGRSSRLGTRNLSGLNGEMVMATAGLCLWPINKDLQVDCKGRLGLVFEPSLGFCSLVSVLPQLLHRF